MLSENLCALCVSAASSCRFEAELMKNRLTILLLSLLVLPAGCFNTLPVGKAGPGTIEKMPPSEGVIFGRVVLVENGRLKSYMHDRISAAHYKIEPTSNGRRECYRYPPVPRMRNTYMTDGPHDPDEIIRSVKKGVLAETFTNGEVRIGSGDFSFYLKNGYLIEDGKITRPVKDANLIGFGPDVLEKVEMVGNDMKMSEGTGTCGKDGQRVPVGMGLPTTQCGGISVGGVG